MSNDRYEKIRKALAKGPMQGPWGATLRDLLAERDALAAEVEALRAEVERLNRILGRIVEGDGDSTVTIRAGTDAFAAAREYLSAPKPESADQVQEAREALKELITWIPSADPYRRLGFLGFDPEAPMRALAKARTVLAKGEQQ